LSKRYAIAGHVCNLNSVLKIYISRILPQRVLLDLSIGGSINSNFRYSIETPQTFSPANVIFVKIKKISGRK